ncbi:hypothetical protein ACIBG8_03995 [Nonomuraea sp. NPDC050556]|uniref:hypothetical protein n=1 Tax=Nonomuraea sp. NPDC050556 TaxID=3364369 RepID=UPI0037A86384
MSRLSGISLALVITLAAVAVPAEAASNAVRVDLSRSMGAFPFSPGRQLSSIPKSWRYGTAANAALDRLDLDQVRVWLKFGDAPEKSYDYLAAYATRSKSLLVNWQSSYSPLVTGGSFTEAELFTAQRDTMADYKRRFPSIEWLESENEVPSIADYYPMYRFTYRVVNAVNAMGLPGPKIKIGGPTTDIFSTRRIGQFLDLYAADQDPHKRLDFISYHQYLIDTSGDPAKWTDTKENPAAIATERTQLNAMLAQRGLSPLPALVSETGIFPRDRQTSLGLPADLRIQAAALASMHYYYLGQPQVTPFHWTVDHPENDRKDLFEDTATGAALPYYNTMLMQSMLPKTRYAAASDALSAQGLGVYGLAGAEPGRVAVMTWNYQWTHQTTYQSKIVLTNFPSEFRTSNVLVTRYKIGSGALAPVEQFVIGPRTDGSYTSQTLELQPNELRLLVLTPTTKPAGRGSAGPGSLR